MVCGKTPPTAITCMVSLGPGAEEGVVSIIIPSSRRRNRDSERLKRSFEKASSAI